jgi:hypothetical protein
MKIGYLDEIIARREAVMGRLSPSAKHAHFPHVYRRPYVLPQETRITVNCRTGERTVERTEAVIRPLSPVPPPKPEPIAPTVRPLQTERQILEATRQTVETLWSVGRDELMSRSTRTRNGERYAVYRLLRKIFGWSFPVIGLFVGRDPTSVMQGIKRSADYYEKGEQSWRDRFDEAAKCLIALKKGIDYPQAPVTRKTVARSQDGVRLCLCCEQPILRLSAVARYCSRRCKKRHNSRRQRETARAA